MNKQPRLSFDVEGTGRYYLLNWDREIAADHKAFIARQITGKHNGDGSAPKRSRVAFIQERFDELAELKSWLDANGVKSHFWVNPMHRKNMGTLAESSIDEFRRRVKLAVGDIPDYSKRTDFCNNDELFYEWKHFRPIAAAQIIREILLGKEELSAQQHRLTADGIERAGARSTDDGAVVVRDAAAVVARSINE